MYSFLGCQSKWPQSQWLKTIEIYSPTVLEARSLTGRTVLPPRLSSGILLAFSSFWLLHILLDLWRHNSSLCLCLHMTFSSSSTMFSFLLSLIRMLVLGLRAYPANAGWLYLNILNIITFAETLFPNKVRFTVPKVATWTYLLEGYH